VRLRVHPQLARLRAPRGVPRQHAGHEPSEGGGARLREIPRASSSALRGVLATGDGSATFVVAGRAPSNRVGTRPPAWQGRLDSAPRWSAADRDSLVECFHRGGVFQPAL
jgi:hypothetical protein